jgi:hypothetical protein
MKRKLLIILLSVCFFNYHSYSQKIYSSEKDVFATKEIVFYGYDYSDFRFADAKRMDEDVKNFIFNWIAYSQRGLSEKEMSSRTYLNKDKIVFNFDPTFELIKKLKSEDLVSITKHSISKDSIQSFIDKYSIKERDGIGFVVIVECFDKYHKTVSGYCTFFDIATKRILISDYFSSKNSDNYNRVNDWGVALGIALREYMWTYYRRQNEFNSNNYN